MAHDLKVVEPGRARLERLDHRVQRHDPAPPPNHALARQAQASNDLQKSRFARAVRADDGNPLAGCYRERDVLQGPSRPAILRGRRGLLLLVLLVVVVILTKQEPGTAE